MPAILALVIALDSCAASRTVPRTDITATPVSHREGFTAFATVKGQRVRGYTTTDGRFHEVNGWARLEGDTMIFHRPALDQGRLQGPIPELTERVATADLESVRSEAVTPDSMVLGIVLASGFIVLMAYARVVGSFRW
jgi:hypothetical protein